MTARARLREAVLHDRAPRPADLSAASALLEAAREQRLCGWLAPRARATDGWPKPVLESLHQDERALLARGLRQLDRAAFLQEQLLARGLRVLPLKGAALAEKLYASVSERAMADVDLLALDAFADTVRVLIELGLQPGERADHAWCLREPSTEQTFELHHALVSCPRLFPFDAEQLWARRERGRGLVTYIPSNEDLLVQLGLHASFQHGLVLSLGQYMDFRRLLESCALDSLRVGRLAQESAAGAALAASLQVASALVGAPSMVALEFLRADLPRGFAAWLTRRCEAPLQFVVPHVPTLVRVRWGLSRGRRLLLLRDTLRPATGQEGFARRCLRLTSSRVSGTFSTGRARRRLAQDRSAP
jgi:Uncharacterised nucleotidyltransferase